MTRRMVAAVAAPGDQRARPLHRPAGHAAGAAPAPQSEFDAEAVFAACAEHDVAVEINSRPERRDPPDDLVALALEAGCLFSIDSDAHAPGQLDFLDLRLRAGRAARRPAGPGGQHLAAGPAAGLGERVACVTWPPPAVAGRRATTPSSRCGARAGGAARSRPTARTTRSW